jgi:3alpha(or 20beta)-hydroxysteroid dehydrogenase
MAAGRLEGKVALISGAARGQGEAEARRFVAEGARVVVADVLVAEAAAVAADLAEDAVACTLDVRDPAGWDEAVRLAVDRFGKLDILVNNAGIVRAADIEHQPVEDFLAVLHTNLLGAWLGIRAAVPALRAAGGGAIVNTSSIAGMQGSPGMAAYSSSKFGLRGLTKVAALELAVDGIRVNSVHPGAVDTAMGPPNLTREQIADALRDQPVPRMATVEEVANLVLFLASDEAAYCTGSEYVIDGGATAGRFRPRPDD